MSGCSQTVFPDKVIQTVRTEVEKVKGDEPIPMNFVLSASMKRADLRDATLVNVLIDKHKGTAMETNVVKGRTVFKNQTGNHKLGTIVLAVRRPGCFFCREQALALSVLVSQLELEYYFDIVGVVKETLDQRGLVEFQTTYFPFVLLCDKSYALYRALGDRKVGASFVLNPKTLVGILCETYTRVTSKDSSASFVGDGLTLGGVIFFDANGNAIYSYEEETGKQLPVKDFLAVVNAIKRDHGVDIG